MCGRVAAFGVIDKIGFMDPGWLCPSHYLTWKHRPGESLFIFQHLPGGESLMKRFMKDRGNRSMCEELLDLISAPQRLGKTMKEIHFDAIVAAYEANGKNAQAACRELGISKATFYRELNRNNYRIGRVMNKKEIES